VAQYIHLLSGTNLGIPGDPFLPASAALPPQRGDQFSAGVAVRWPHWRITLEGYHRRSDAQVRFRPDCLDVGLPLPEDWLARTQRGGLGRAYGAEFMVQAEYLRFSGWLAYTWSRGLWQFPGDRTRPSPFDRPHQIDLSVKLRITKRKSFYANWVYQSGRPIYLAVAQAADLNWRDQNGLPLASSSPTLPTYDVNAEEALRTPAYHRLDLGYQVKRKGKRAYWRMGVYNLYNRVNVLVVQARGGSYSFNSDQNQWTRIREPRLVGTGFLPILPYVGYSWEF